jgi:hypothetical protein
VSGAGGGELIPGDPRASKDCARIFKQIVEHQKEECIALFQIFYEQCCIQEDVSVKLPDDPK